MNDIQDTRNDLEHDNHSALPEKRAILVGVCLPDTERFEESMEELKGLTEALGLEIVGYYTQNLPRVNASHYIGKGKIEEIRRDAEWTEADVIIFNNTLSPSQLTNLSDALETEILDRTNLILNIFAERARTGEARMQVDYAKLKYMLPRLVGLRSNLSRQGGTSASMSNRGAGEQKIELDRRHIERRMTLLRKKLDALEKDRLIQRRQRERAGIPLVSLVGYTNAGKSTLLNLMIETYNPDESKQVLSENILFATLDTQVRRIEPEGQKPFLLSDTVGFIDDLPTSLVSAFRSTLDEALHADLLLEVIDCSDPQWEAQTKVTANTLAKLGAGHIPMIQVMNKADLLLESKSSADDSRILPAVPQALPTDSPELPVVKENRIWMSAKEGTGLSELIDMIENELNKGHITCDLLIPYTESRLENTLRTTAQVHSCTYEADGIAIHVTLDEAGYGRFKQFII